MGELDPTMRQQTLFERASEAIQNAREHINGRLMVLGATGVAAIGGAAINSSYAEAGQGNPQVLDGKEFNYPDNPDGKSYEELLYGDCRFGVRYPVTVHKIAISKKTGNAVLSLDRKKLDPDCDDYLNRNSITFKLDTKLNGQKNWDTSNSPKKVGANNRGRTNYKVQAEAGKCAAGRTMFIRPNLTTTAINYTMTNGISLKETYGDTLTETYKMQPFRAKCPS